VRSAWVEELRDQAGQSWVGELGPAEVVDVADVEPADLVMLVGCGVDRLPDPVSDDTHGHRQAGVVKPGRPVRAWSTNTLDTALL